MRLNDYNLYSGSDLNFDCRLQGNVVEVPLPPLKGAYGGLFEDEDECTIINETLWKKDSDHCDSAGIVAMLLNRAYLYRCAKYPFSWYWMVNSK